MLGGSSGADADALEAQALLHVAAAGSGRPPTRRTPRSAAAVAR